MYTRIDIIYKIGSNEREVDVSKIVKIYFSTLLFLYTSLRNLSIDLSFLVSLPWLQLLLGL